MELNKTVNILCSAREHADFAHPLDLHYYRNRFPLGGIFSVKVSFGQRVACTLAEQQGRSTLNINTSASHVDKYNDSKSQNV